MTRKKPIRETALACAWVLFIPPRAQAAALSAKASLVIQDGVDDQKPDSAGNSGPRVLSGVISR